MFPIHRAYIEVQPSITEAWEAEAEAMALAQDVAEVTATGICATLRHWQHEEAEAALYERCLVVQFDDDPITRMGGFDGYEMAGLTAPIRQRCASQGCPRCRAELDELDRATWGRNY